MVTFQRCGWMGQCSNQLFQYATLLGLAKLRGYEYGIPLKTNTKSNDRFKRLALQDGFEGLTCKDSSHLSAPIYVEQQKPNQQKLWVEPDKTQWTFNPKVHQLPDGTDLQGFFQTEKYFKHIRPQLLKEFEPKKEHKEKVGNYVALLKHPLIFIHVRRGDALGNGSLTKIGDSVDYFHQAIKHFPDCHFVVLSDDMTWCQANLFNYNPIKRLYGGLSEEDKKWRSEFVSWSPFGDKFLDLQLMRMADGGIISNSSFSWWGAWLGRPDRKIVAPLNWSENVPCQDVFAEGWVKV